MRNPLTVTLSVWQALFLREALDRLFRMRAAWFWLLIEPVIHIGFLAFVFSVIRVRTMSGIDVALWIIVGLLAFFLFRRTAIQVMYGVDCNKALFAYRQVKPIDPALVRGALEAFIMAVVTIVVITVAGLLDHVPMPSQPLLIFAAVFGLWLLGMAYGLVASVLMELVPETEHILKILMLPLYLISGVIFPITFVPAPYRDYLLYNPVLHGIEFVRIAFSDYYHAVPGLSLNYLYGFAITGIFIGLILHRRFAQTLTTR